MMIKKILILLCLLSANGYASQPTVIEIQMMQNRVIKTTNVDTLVVSICDAIMDLKEGAQCMGVSQVGFIRKFTKTENDFHEKISAHPLMFAAYSKTKCGKLACDSIATINLTKHDEKSFKINIKISNGGQANFDPAIHKKYFDSIGNSLFLNKAGVELGMLNE
jgi:hypothetical protein